MGKCLKDDLRESKFIIADSQGYTQDYNGNVYCIKDEHKKMFEHGSGQELKEKARAAHSSSMLSYNFFSWIDKERPFKWNGGEYTEVFFEVKLRTLIKPYAAANMDVVLKGEKGEKDSFVFIESKFLEYTGSEKFDLSESYKTQGKYYENYGAWPKRIETWEDKIKRNEIVSKYQGGIKQSFCHLIGLTNLNDKRALDWFNTNNSKHEIKLHIDNIDDIDICFANVIFEPSNKDYGKENSLYNLYKEDYDCFIKLLTGTNYEPKWLSYSSLWKDMREQLEKYDGKRVEYLQGRYMQFAK